MLNAAAWNADLVRDDLRAYVIEHFGAPDGILIVDETGFLKKGTKSAGVARQACGMTGRRENQQIGVFLAYASSQGCAFIDRALYIPEEWAVNRARRTAAGIPPTVQFATQGGLAQAMLARAFAADLPMKWVVGAPLAGQATLRAWLDQRACNYVLGVPATQRVWTQGRQVEAQWLMEQLSPRAWTRWQRATGATDRRRTSGPGGPFPPRNRPGGGSGCSSGARCGSGPRAPTFASPDRPTHPSLRWCGWLSTAGRLNGGLRRQTGPSGWISTRSEPGRPGIATSPWPCSPMRTWKSRGRRTWPGTRKHGGADGVDPCPRGSGWSRQRYQRCIVCRQA